MKFSEFNLDAQSKETLVEINSLFKQNQDSVLENKASHILQSAIHLLEHIDSQYDTEEADLLRKRFFSCLRNKTPDKFIKSLSKLKKD